MDRNPAYVDTDVAPPAMLQVWTMGRPRIEGIAARGGAADEIDPDGPVSVLASAGFRGTLATNSELEFVRYLRVGDELESTSALDAVSELKATALGVGYFVTWVTTSQTVSGEVVGRQHFRIFKFDPTRTAADLPPRPARAASTSPEPTPTKTPGVELPRSISTSPPTSWWPAPSRHATSCRCTTTATTHKHKARPTSS